MKTTAAQRNATKKRYFWYRLAIIAGVGLASLGFGLMLFGQYWGFLLILAAIPLAGIHRVIPLASFRP